MHAIFPGVRLEGAEKSRLVALFRKAGTLERHARAAGKFLHQTEQEALPVAHVRPVRALRSPLDGTSRVVDNSWTPTRGFPLEPRSAANVPLPPPMKPLMQRPPEFLEISPMPNGVFVVALARPSVLNALSRGLCLELTDCFSALRSLPADQVRAVILTGRGRAFCSGADLKERRDLDRDEWPSHHLAFEHLSDALWSFPAPLIVAVNGPALGGGCELVLHGDVVLVSESAWFALPEVGIGIIPGMGGTQLLPARIGYLRAAEMLLTARRVAAAEAVTWGLATATCGTADCLEASLEIASGIAARPPQATRAAKEALRHATAAGFAAGIKAERELYASLIAAGSGREGVLRYWRERGSLSSCRSASPSPPI